MHKINEKILIEVVSNELEINRAKDQIHLLKCKFEVQGCKHLYQKFFISEKNYASGKKLIDDIFENKKIECNESITN